jgi:DNA-binding transcriptional LysR family regulator
VVALQRGSGFRRHVESIFASAGLEFRPAVEVGNLSLVRRFVAAGLGVAPVPAVAFSVRDRFRGVRTLRFTGASPVTYYRAIRAGAPLPATARQLLDHLAD